MNYLHYWRKWIRPFFAALYIILALIAVPLCVIELNKEGKPKHVQAWFAGGIFVMCAVPISLWGILQHLINYTQPNLQRHIIRILWMVPIYAVNSWFALRFPEAAIYLDTVRECYEAYVIYNFLAYLLNFLWTKHPQLDLVIREKPQVKHFIPFCLFPPWPMTGTFIKRCKHGALQYTIVRPVTTVIALICQLFDKYDEGDFNFTSAWSYLVIINNISQIWAMYCLILFYKAMKEELSPIKPVPKFLCVKFVVFFSFWQAVLIAALTKLGAIPQDGNWDFYGSIKEVATGIQDFCICVEMFVAAIAHYYSFSHKPFINDEAEQTNCCRSFFSMWDVSDMKDDVVEHVKVIGKTVTKTISRSKLQNNESERMPLLQENAHQTEENVQVPVTTDITASLRSCDWDATSVDVNPPYHKKGSTTASMSNYIDFGSSMDSSDKLVVNEQDGGLKDVKQNVDQESESDLDKTKLLVTVEHHSAKSHNSDLVSENTLISLANDNNDDKNDNDSEVSSNHDNISNDVKNDNEISANNDDKKTQGDNSISDNDIKKDSS